MIVAATKTFHTVTSVLIINLAISDFLVGIGVMPFAAVSIMNNGWVNWNVSRKFFTFPIYLHSALCRMEGFKISVNTVKLINYES